jgi:hypothetical protein
MKSQWKQFIELYAEKNQHLSKQEVLQMAKKPFQQLKQYYKQQGGQSRVSSFPICEEQITPAMLGDGDEDDIMLLETKNYPDNGELYDKFCKELQEIISADCHGVVLNGTDVLYSYYDREILTDKQKKEDEVIRENLYTDIRKNLLNGLICSGSNAFFDIYMFEDRWYVGRDIEFGPRKYHIEYNSGKRLFNISLFTKSKDSFGL